MYISISKMEVARNIRSMLDIANAEQNADSISRQLYVRDCIRHAVFVYVNEGIDSLLDLLSIWDNKGLLKITLFQWDSICDMDYVVKVGTYE